jgi:hypothetical protein
MVPVRLRPRPGPGVREGGRQKLAVAFALAAALAVFAVGWWAWPHSRPNETGAARLADQRTRAMQLADAHDRVRRLADLTDQALVEARALENDPHRLEDLASVYKKIVLDDLTSSVDALPEGKRAAVVGPLVAQLRGHESAISRRATEVRNARTGDALRAMADDTRLSERRLLALLPASLESAMSQWGEAKQAGPGGWFSAGPALSSSSF